MLPPSGKKPPPPLEPARFGLFFEPLLQHTGTGTVRSASICGRCGQGPQQQMGASQTSSKCGPGTFWSPAVLGERLHWTTRVWVTGIYQGEMCFRGHGAKQQGGPQGEAGGFEESLGSFDEERRVAEEPRKWAEGSREPIFLSTIGLWQGFHERSPARHPMQIPHFGKFPKQT